jgi:hypothetical protein
MKTSLVRTAVAALTICLCAPPATATSGLGGIAGRVMDTSGAALPGVTVTASCERHDSRISTVTDGRGEYSLAGLPPGVCSVAFELQGFTTGPVPAVRLQPDETRLVDSEMAVAPMSETVEVFAQRPPQPDPPPLPPPPVPTPSLRPVAPYDLSAVCGPSLAAGETPPMARVVGSRYDAKRQLYAKGDIVLVDGGQAAGVQAGDNFVVRRRFKALMPKPDAGRRLVGEHSAGLIQVVEVRADSADAVVVHSCGAFRAGDYLVPFVPSLVRAVQPRGTPDYDRSGKILLADEGQQLGAPNRMVVVDYGENRGAQPGQRLTVFRRHPDNGPALIDVGEAVVVAVRPESATVRIEYARDAVYLGDLVAPQR